MPYTYFFKERLKKEYKHANKQREGYVDDSEDEDEEELTRDGKSMKKLIRKMEKNAAYDSDDEGNPYASSVSMCIRKQISADNPTGGGGGTFSYTGINIAISTLSGSISVGFTNSSQEPDQRSFDYCWFPCYFPLRVWSRRASRASQTRHKSQTPQSKSKWC